MKVTIYNRQKVQKIPGETVKLIEKAVKSCVKSEGFPYKCEVVITLTDNDEIREINKEYRGIDKPTDVLSFPVLEYVNGKPEILPSDIDPVTKRVSLGDIIISVEKANEQAEAFGHSTEREFAFLAVHGMLHLLGYDHETVDEEKVMFSKQEEILNGLGLRRE
ncbi:MAG: rRNA maturation RNase YbeY [Clostridiaceae bacterium]|nr:rRNA maturation RNase YbeY [Clostridiaceae bacterium]